jgi:hypothetical protein
VEPNEWLMIRRRRRAGVSTKHIGSRRIFTCSTFRRSLKSGSCLCSWTTKTWSFVALANYRLAAVDRRIDDSGHASVLLGIRGLHDVLESLLEEDPPQSVAG